MGDWRLHYKGVAIGKTNSDMAKKRFKIRARLVFSGEVVIAAATRQEAEAIAEKGLHALLGKVEADPTAQERITDWEFGTHAEVSVNRKEGK